MSKETSHCKMIWACHVSSSMMPQETMLVKIYIYRVSKGKPDMTIHQETKYHVLYCLHFIFCLISACKLPGNIFLCKLLLKLSGILKVSLQIGNYH